MCYIYCLLIVYDSVSVKQRIIEDFKIEFVGHGFEVDIERVVKHIGLGDYDGIGKHVVLQNITLRFRVGDEERLAKCWELGSTGSAVLSLVWSIGHGSAVLVGIVVLSSTLRRCLRACSYLGHGVIDGHVLRLRFFHGIDRSRLDWTTLVFQSLRRLAILLDDTIHQRGELLQYLIRFCVARFQIARQTLP